MAQRSQAVGGAGVQGLSLQETGIQITTSEERPTCLSCNTLPPVNQSAQHRVSTGEPQHYTPHG
eukprot:7441011-Alexandrium_andersonii.AAC.1